MNKAVLDELVFDFLLDVIKYLRFEIDFYNKHLLSPLKEEEEFTKEFSYGQFTYSKFNKYWNEYCEKNDFSNDNKIDFITSLINKLEHTNVKVNEKHEILFKKLNEWDVKWNGNLPSFLTYFENELDCLNRDIDNSNASELFGNDCAFNKGQKFVILKEMGLLESDAFKKTEKYTQESKQQILASILDCDIRTAKSFINAEDKYLPKGENLNDVMKYLKNKERK